MKKVLEVKNVKKKLGRREIIKGITFDVNEGEVFGFLGPNGAGKTTTIRMLVDLIHPDSGEIIINGYNIKTDKTEALNSLGAVVENPELYKLIGNANGKAVLTPSENPYITLKVDKNKNGLSALTELFWEKY